jgi:MFS family permease
VAWAVLNFLHGAIGGVPWVVSEIWMNVVVEENRRGRVMGLSSALVAVGMALGPIVLQVVGVYGPVPFLTGAALSLLVAVPVAALLAQRAAHPGRCRERLRHGRAAGAARHVRGLCCGLGEQVAFSFPAGLCGQRRRRRRHRRALAVRPS